jgi:hypothetical protein
MRLFRTLVCSLVATCALACSSESGSGPEAAAKLGVRVQPSGAQVGAPLRVQPVVEIQDASGKLVGGSSAQVTVALTGTGTIRGTTTVTAVGGVATFADLELGGLVGDRTMTFSSTGLSSVSAQSLALAAGAAKSLVLTVSPSSDAQTMITLPQQPVVQAVDAEGNSTAFAGAVVASVVNGNATIAAGASASTNANGAAAFSGLTLGGLNGNVGVATLQFTAPGVNPVTASVRLSCSERAAATGTLILGTLATGDCALFSGRYAHQYTVTPAALSAYSVTIDAAFRTFLHVQGPTESLLFWGFESGTSSNRLNFSILVPAGRSKFLAGAFSAATVGGYSLRVDPRSTDVTCTTVLVAAPITTSQRIGTADCNESGYLGDYYFVGLPPGATVNASVTNAAFQPAISVWQYAATNTRVANAAGTNAASVTYTNTTGFVSYFYVYVGTQAAGMSGTYDLSLGITYPPGFIREGAPSLQVPRISPGGP